MSQFLVSNTNGIVKLSKGPQIRRKQVETKSNSQRSENEKMGGHFGLIHLNRSFTNMLSMLLVCDTHTFPYGAFCIFQMAEKK